MAAEQPKKPMTAYFLYLNENRAAIVKKLGDQAKSKGLVAKTGAQQWNALSAAAKMPYEKRAAAAKQEYDKAVQTFKANGGVIMRKRKADKKPKKDKNLPKKPSGGGYGVYLSEHRADIVKSLPAGSNPITDVAKAAGPRWKALSDAAKKPYEAKFTAKMKEYQAAMEAYKATKGAAEGEDEENEEEEEDEEEEDEEDEEEEEEEKPAAKKAKVNEAKPAAKQAKASEEKPVAKQAKVSESNVMEDVKKRGFMRQFKTLTENPKLKTMPVNKILDALTSADGGVIAAKKALLGA